MYMSKRGADNCQITVNTQHQETEERNKIAHTHSSHSLLLAVPSSTSNSNISSILSAEQSNPRRVTGTPLCLFFEEVGLLGFTPCPVGLLCIVNQLSDFYFWFTVVFEGNRRVACLIAFMLRSRLCSVLPPMLWRTYQLDVAPFSSNHNLAFIVPLGASATWLRLSLAQLSMKSLLQRRLTGSNGSVAWYAMYIHCFPSDRITPHSPTSVQLRPGTGGLAPCPCGRHFTSGGPTWQSTFDQRFHLACDISRPSSLQILNHIFCDFDVFYSRLTVNDRKWMRYF
eukprot:c11417_g1_i4.p1 GENE.c11417_g1_i4~~c11417_g1_i4.p1  ORF type:complete len:283 (+),score=-0.45 c11417_g1_i4:224-1072(+)